MRAASLHSQICPRQAPPPFVASNLNASKRNGLRHLDSIRLDQMLAGLLLSYDTHSAIAVPVPGAKRYQTERHLTFIIYYAMLHSSNSLLRHSSLLTVTSLAFMISPKERDYLVMSSTHVWVLVSHLVKLPRQTGTYADFCILGTGKHVHFS